MVHSDGVDFNSFVCSHYWHQATCIAFRFIDLKCENWERLACEWHQRYSYGKKCDPQDVYFDGNIQRRRSIDALLLNPEISPQAEIMFYVWEMEKKRLAAMRDAPPIEPPAPIPPIPPKPAPVPEPKPEPKKPRPEWLVRWGAYATILTPVVLLATNFLPPPWNIVGKAIWELIKLLF